MYDDRIIALLHALYTLEKASKHIQRNRYSEFNCSSNLTDADMLRIQIDGALDAGDKELFMKLTDQLQEVEG